MRSITMLAALGFSLFSITAHASHRTRLNDTSVETYDLRAGSPLSVETFNGSIHIRGGDDSQVHVTMHTHIQADGEEAARRAMAEMKVRVSHENGGLVLTAPNPRRDDDEVEGGVSFDISVPRSISLTLQTTNGSIDVSDTRGDNVLRTTNGQIIFAHGAGSVDAETTNGGIRVDLRDVTPGRPLRFITTNGGVSLELPSNLAADVEASTTNGTISSDLPVLTNHAESHRLSGRVNGGGQELRVRTTNGTITIRSAAAGE
jgi:DUF4097 and DUF4098 domain-containing protein YvlB